jgi:hypothetical protein
MNLKEGFCFIRPIIWVIVKLLYLDLISQRCLFTVIIIIIWVIIIIITIIIINIIMDLIILIAIIKLWFIVIKA